MHPKSRISGNPLIIQQFGFTITEENSQFFFNYLPYPISTSAPLQARQVTEPYSNSAHMF